LLFPVAAFWLKELLESNPQPTQPKLLPAIALSASALAELLPMSCKVGSPIVFAGSC
jgi:hypothetical protein